MISDDVKFYKTQRHKKLSEESKLDFDIARLMTRRQALDDEIAALDVLLKSAGYEVNKTPDHSAKRFPANIGFRDAVREILRDGNNNMGLSTKEIRENLLARGYSYTKETPLPIRIGNEMRRMVLQGIMVKDGKKYSLTKKGWNM